MRSLQRLVAGLFVFAAVSSQLLGQFDTEGSQVISYFPQLADGGPASQQWVTSLTFVNPHRTLTAYGAVHLNGNDGNPLALDFGSGPQSTFNFSVPPQGSAQFTSTGASSSIVTGWAVVDSSLPLEGVVQFRVSVGGTPVQAVSALSTPASQQFRSPATPSTGVAVANVNSAPINISIAVLDSKGSIVGTSSLTLGALAHQSFNISQMFPSLAATFRGSILLNSQTPSYTFVAWTLSGEGGVLSNYPPAALEWPVSQYERIWRAWQKIQGASMLTPTGVFTMPNPPQLVVDYSTATINSYALPSQNTVHIFMNLAELISDSESELGFVVGHETGHIIQYQTGHLIFDQSNIESDADIIGMFLALEAGYDPYGAAGALAKLAMASGTAGLVDQNFDNILAGIGVDPHTSFNDRLQVVFSEMQALCALPQAQSFCLTYKGAIHPHFPPSAPLSHRPSPAPPQFSMN
jgi:hypothetical protein